MIHENLTIAKKNETHVIFPQWWQIQGINWRRIQTGKQRWNGGPSQTYLVRSRSFQVERYLLINLGEPKTEKINNNWLMPLKNMFVSQEKFLRLQKSGSSVEAVKGKVYRKPLDFQLDFVVKAMAHGFLKSPSQTDRARYDPAFCEATQLAIVHWGHRAMLPATAPQASFFSWGLGSFCHRKYGRFQRSISYKYWTWIVEKSGEIVSFRWVVGPPPAVFCSFYEVDAALVEVSVMIARWQGWWGAFWRRRYATLCTLSWKLLHVCVRGQG